MSYRIVFAAVMAAFAAGIARAEPSEPAVDANTNAPAVDPRVRSLLDRLPLAYEVNCGQAPEDYDFHVRCRGYRAFVSSQEVVFSFDGAALRMSLEGAARVEPQTRGLELAGRANYFIGDDAAKWVTEIPLTRGADYRDAAPGTTWTFGAQGRALTFEFVLDAGVGGPSLRLDGAESVKVADDGSLRIEMPRGVARMSAPIAWQDLPDMRLPAVARWVAAADGMVRIEVAAKDPSRRVHVDPTVTYETYLGGSQGDHFIGAAMDAAGNGYACGGTDSSNFPTTSGAFDTSLTGGGDALVVKFSADGTSLVYATYIGGTRVDEYMQDVIVDSSGRAYFVGSSGSSDWPTTAGVYSPGPSGNGVRGVMAALNSSGSGLVFSSYTQGYARSIAFGPSGSFYVADSVGIARYSAGAVTQIFYRQLMPTGPQPNGGFDTNDCAADSNGYAYVVGNTNWSYPTTTGAYQTSNAGGSDGYVTKVASDGTTVYSTWLGGSTGDVPRAVAVNLAGQAYVTGYTTSSNFPVTADAFKSTITTAGADEAFLTRLDASGSTLRYSTFLGKGNGVGLAVHPGSSCVVAGYTQNSAFDVLDAFQGTYGGNQDGFAMKFHRDGTRAWSSFIGGSNADNAQGVGMAPDGSVVIAGVSSSSDLPTTSAYQASSNGSYEPFVLKVPDTLPVVTPLTIAPPTLATWTVGYPFSTQFTGTGGVNEYTWSYWSGTMPAGVTVSAGGLLAGTPTQTGTFDFKIRLYDTSDLAVERQYSWRVNPPPSIDGPSMADATMGTPYARAVPVVNGSGTMTFELLAGAPPPGTSLAADGSVAGIPTQSGQFTFGVRVTDARGATGEGSVSIRVNVQPSVTATAVPDGTEGRPLTIQFAGTGGSMPLSWNVVMGTIPTLTGIDPVLARLSGTAKPAGNYTFTVRATDAAGATAERSFVATVNPVPQITALAIPTAAAGRPFSFVLPRTGGTAPFEWILDSGELPPGMSLDAPTGALGGTPSSASTTTVVFGCTDARGARVTAGYAVAVAGWADLSKRLHKEKLTYTLEAPRRAHRFVELTEGSLLSIDVLGGANDGTPPMLQVYDSTGTEWDLLEWLKEARKSVKVKEAPVPATGRYFLVATAAGGFTGTMRLAVRVTPAGKWSGEAALDASEPLAFRFAAPPGSKVSIVAKATKGSAALPSIVSVTAPDATDLVPGGKTVERGASAKFTSEVPLAGGDYLVEFATRDGTSGEVTWTVKLKLPKNYEFEMPDVPAGD